MILNHGVLGAYPGDLLDGVAGVSYYGARVIASSYPGDICQMHPDLSNRRLLDPILRHYERVGLQVTNHFEFNESWNVAKKYPKHVLDAFYFGDEANAVANRPDFAAIAETMNNKNKFIEFCHVQGVPVPGTRMFDTKTEFDVADLPAFPMYVKGAVSASGMHVIRCENSDELHRAVDMMPGQFQVQEALPNGTVFCNIQYEVIGNKLHHGPLTKQKLNGNAHNGNTFLCGIDPDLIQPITDKLSKTLFEKGMAGTWAYDVAVHNKRVWLIEMNPRWNGASYYSKPAERLGAKAWEGQYVKPKHTNFDFMFRLPNDWEYSPSRRNGIIFINWAPIMAGKLGLLVIGSAEQRFSLLSTFQQRFCLFQR